MMKNTVLFTILVGLLYYAYQHEEVEKGQIFESKTLLSRLNVSEKKLLEITGPKFDLELSTFPYVTKHLGLPVDSLKVGQLIQEFANLKIKREFTQEEMSEEAKQRIIDQSVGKIVFYGENGRSIVTLGPALLKTNMFYVSVVTKSEHKWFLVENDAPMTQAYNPEAMPSNFGHLRTKKLFELSDKDFLKSKIFSDTEKVSKVNIDINTKFPFEIDLIGKRTVPEIPTGLEYNESEFDEFKRSLQQTRAIDIKRGLTQKKSLLRQVKIYLSDGSEKQIDIFRTNSGQYWILKDSLFYEVRPITADLFSSNWQDFWMKTPFPKNFLEKSKLKMSMYSKNELIPLEVPFDKEFRVVSQKRQIVPNNEKFQELFQLLSGSDQFGQAARVSTTPIKETIENALKIKFSDFDLEIFRKGKELIINNKTYNFNLHYYMINDEKVELEPERYFY